MALRCPPFQVLSSSLNHKSSCAGQDGHSGTGTALGNRMGVRGPPPASKFPSLPPLPGWSGWGCTDNAAAFSYGFQLLSTLLLCLSNLMFVPPVAIAVRSNYVLEAVVYIFTMFFSTVSQGWGRAVRRFPSLSLGPR